jgi:hypothetical protein
MTRGTSTMSVYLSWTESEVWASDPAERAAILRTFASAARARGRRNLAVFAEDGRKLHFGPAATEGRR